MELFTTGAISNSCSVTFTGIINFTVTPIGNDVSVAPNTPQSVPQGSTQTFVITPQTGYVVSNTVGGNCQAGSFTGYSYTTGAINNSCTVIFNGVAANPVTTITVYTSQNPIVQNNQIVLSAKVSSASGAIPRGTVNFRVNGASIAGCTAQTMQNGLATCTTSTLPLASPVALTAIYNPTVSLGFNSSTSPEFYEYVVSSIVVNTVPDAPYDVLVTPNDGGVSVNWFPPANTGGQVINSYQVLYGVTSSFTYNTPGCSTTGTNCDINGLVKGTDYTFTVVATNATGSSPVGFSSLVAPASNLSANPTKLSLSINDVATNAALTGNPRAVVLTNNSSTSISNINIQFPGSWTGGINPSATHTCLGSLAPFTACSITVTPGTTATSTCTNGTLPTPQNITVSSSSQSLTIPVEVLGYACQFQQGYVFSVDDNAPLTGSIGGKVVTKTNVANNVTWSVTNDVIDAVGDESTIAVPQPAPFGQLLIYQLSCNGATDGACDTNNIAPFYSFFNSAAGLCTVPISGYFDWYLPGICEMGSSFILCDDITPTLQTIGASLIGHNFFVGDYWSSTERSAAPQTQAWYETFPGGTNQNFQNKSLNSNVICTRKLTL